MATDVNFLDINLDAHLEKKNGLDYLPWALVWREFIRKHPGASWHVYEFNGLPVCYLKDGSAFVKVGIFTAPQSEEKTCWLPVMDHKNKAVINPNAFEVNKTIMRCLVKTAAMFGLGLNVYNGETFNEANDEAPKKTAPAKLPVDAQARAKSEAWAKAAIKALEACAGDSAEVDAWMTENKQGMDYLKAKHNDLFNEVLKTVGM